MLVTKSEAVQEVGTWTGLTEGLGGMRTGTPKKKKHPNNPIFSLHHEEVDGNS